MQSLTAFIIALLAILAVPGPTNTLLALSGASVGLSRSLYLLCFELAGYETAIAFIRVIIVPLLRRLPGHTRVIHAVAAIYLVGLAVMLWRRRLDRGLRLITAHQVLIATLLNPKALIIALVLIPVSATRTAPYWWTLSLMIPLIGTGWICVGRLAGQALPPRLATAIPRFGSLVLVAFAAALIATVLQ